MNLLQVGSAEKCRLEMLGNDTCLAAVLGAQERGSCVYRVMQEGRSVCWEVGSCEINCDFERLGSCSCVSV